VFARVLSEEAAATLLAGRCATTRCARRSELMCLGRAHDPTLKGQAGPAATSRIFAAKDLPGHPLKFNWIKRFEKARQDSILFRHAFGVAAGYEKDGAPAVH
jgi:hypothetical protein